MNDRDLNLSTLSQLFSDESAAREFLEQKRWPNGAICPHCGAADKAYRLTAKAKSKCPVREGVWKCGACRQQFTVTVGTIFEDSHLPISKWLAAIHLMCSSKKGVSALQIKRELGIAYKSAWFMCHRIREAMRREPLAGMLKGTVEADETYVGGKPRKGTGKHVRGRGTKRKPVFALVERGGNIRVKPIERVTAKQLKGAIRETVDSAAKIVTDDFQSYKRLDREFTHSVVNHASGSYVNAEGEHTNTAESFFALLKRGHYGTFHQMSRQHLQRYCDEFAFRWDHRKITDGERMVEAINGAEGKRLTYHEPLSQ